MVPRDLALANLALCIRARLPTMDPWGKGARDGPVGSDHRSSRVLAPGQCRFGWIDFPVERLRARRAAKPNQCARGTAAHDGRAATYPGPAAYGRAYDCPNQRADAYSRRGADYDDQTGTARVRAGSGCSDAGFPIDAGWSAGRLPNLSEDPGQIGAAAARTR